MRAALHLSASLAAGEPLAPEAALPAPFKDADDLVTGLRIRATLDGLDPAELTEAMQTDKKRAASGLRFIVLDDIGEGRVASGVPPEMVSAAWAYACRVGASGEA